MTNGTATGQGLLDFLTFAAEKGLMNANTAGSYKAASKEVLETLHPDDWASVDVNEIDVDDYIGRFERLKVGKYKPSSLTVYKARFRSAIQHYSEYLKSPSTWRYKAERPASARKPSNGRLERKEAQPRNSASDSGSSILEYPFPLRRDLVITLALPSDLTRQEAKRLASHLDSLAVDEMLALPPAKGAPEEKSE